MSPLRLIIIAILIYIGYRLIFGGKKKVSGNQQDHKDSSKQQPIEDVLVEDPICKNLVPKQQAIQVNDEGKIIYFCSEKCCNQYVAEKGEEQ